MTEYYCSCLIPGDHYCSCSSVLSCGWTHSGSGCQTRRRWWWSLISQSLVFYSSRYLTVSVSQWAALWRWSGVSLSHPLLNHSIKAVRGDALFDVYISFLCHLISHSNHQPRTFHLALHSLLFHLSLSLFL